MRVAHKENLENKEFDRLKELDKMAFNGMLSQGRQPAKVN